MTEASIRRAGTADAFVVAALHLQLARDLGATPEPGYLDRFADAWLRDRPDRPTWIAESDGQHAGILLARRLRSLPWPHRPDASRLHVEALFVVPAHRRRGTGRALLEGAVEWARTTEVTGIHLEVPDLAASAVARSAGFVADDGHVRFDLAGAR